MYGGFFTCLSGKVGKMFLWPSCLSHCHSGCLYPVHSFYFSTPGWSLKVSQKNGWLSPSPTPRTHIGGSGTLNSQVDFGRFSRQQVGGKFSAFSSTVRVYIVGDIGPTTRRLSLDIAVVVICHIFYVCTKIINSLSAPIDNGHMENFSDMFKALRR